MTALESGTATVHARLAEAAASGEVVEVILVLRGKVRPARGPGRWRVRMKNRHVISFRGEWVVATTRVSGPRPR